MGKAVGGEKLTSVYKGLIDSIPLRWRAKLGLIKVTKDNPIDVEVSSLVGGIVASSVEQERTNERKKTDFSLDDPSGKSMTEYFRTDSGQIATRTIKYVPDGTALAEMLATTVEARQDASGNGFVEQVTSTVPNVFSGNDYSVERPDVIPPDFGALLKLTQTQSDVAGTASLPTLGTAEVMRSEKQLTEQVKRITLRSRDTSSLPLTILNTETNDKKQLVLVTRTWCLDTTVAPTPTALLDVQFVKLGDGTALQTKREISSVFSENEFAIERPDPVPEEFRVLAPATETSSVQTGTAVAPTLGTGDLKASQRQLDSFRKLVTILTRSGITLPVVLTNVETNEQKQVVTITRTLRVAGTNPTPTATLDVVVQALGDGNVVETKRSISSIFTADEYVKERPDPVPEEFRVLVPATQTTNIQTGIAAVPTLGTGDLRASQRQLDSFRKLVTVLTRSGITLPVNLVNIETNNQKQVVTVTRTLRVAGTDPTPTELKDVVVQALGDGNVLETKREIASIFTAEVFSIERPDNIPERFKATVPLTTTQTRVVGTASAPTLGAGEVQRTERQLDMFIKEVVVVGRDVSSFPTLEGQTYDEGLDIVIPYTESIETAGTGIGSSRTEITPLGGGLEIVKVFDASELAAALDAYMAEFPGTANVNFPDVLLGMSIEWEKPHGDGDYSETASAIAVNSGWNVSPRGSGQASAAIIPTLLFNTRQRWGQHLPTKNYLFYLPSPVSEADILARIGSVSSWPDFNPESHLIVCKGEKLSLRVDAQVQTSIYDSGDGQSSETHSNGSGASREVTPVITSTHIPPTIHGVISVGSLIADTQDITAHADASTDFDNATRDETGTVAGSVSPGSVAATAGDTAIPSGTFLLDSNCEPAGRLNYVRVHAETVDL